MIVVLFFSILSPLGCFATWTHNNVGFAQIHPRQAGNCTTQCGTIEGALACNSTECACPILNSAGSAGVSTCVNCLTTSSPYLAANLTLFANVCSMCESQCSTSLTAYIQTLSCNTTACQCTLYLGVGSTALTTCAACVKKFNPTDAAGLLAFAQACGLNVTAPSSSASQTSSASSTATYPTASTAIPPASSACRLGFGVIWLTAFLGFWGITVLVW